jgi:hypothetical protein
MDGIRILLADTAEAAATHLEEVAARTRAVTQPPTAMKALLAKVDVGLSDDGRDPLHVAKEVATVYLPASHNSCGGRYFGFVTGGALPAAVAADWLVSACDQNGWNDATSPAAAQFEGVAVRWLLELLNLPVRDSRFPIADEPQSSSAASGRV